jgi:hypothetical protein
MKIVSRILVSLILGSFLYVVILFGVFRLHMPISVTKILLWNVVLFGFLGRGEPVGYMPDGAPIYDGSVGFLGMSWESIFTGFIIYPFIFFVALTILRSHRKS